MSLKHSNKLILVSASPRRKELLNQLGMDIIQCPVDVEETIDKKNISPYETAELIAEKKIDEYLKSPKNKNWVLAADTFLYFNNKIIGKPKDKKEAEETLKSLSGKTHKVITGYVLYIDKLQKKIRSHSVTEVYFKELDQQIIDWYLEQNEWQDAAGAYKIQAKGTCLVDKINGSYNNVVGLPIEVIYEILIQNKYPF